MSDDAAARPIGGPGGRLVDVHSHVYTPAYADYLRRRDLPPRVEARSGQERFVLFPGDTGVWFGPDFTSVDAKLAFMDAHGVGRSVLSLGNPWLDVCDGDESVPLADEINDELAAIARHPSGRLACMGVLPTAGVSHAVKAMESLPGRGLCGAAISASFLGLALDDPALEALWDAAAGLSLPLFIHPQAGLNDAGLNGYGQTLTLSLSFPFETTLSIARMILSGVFDRHPGLKVVAAHGGGTMPYLLGRLARALDVDDWAAGRGLVAQWPDGLVIDSIVHSSPVLEMCAEVLGTRGIVYGTDHPFPIADPAAGRASVSRVDVDGDIAFRNAEAIFGSGFGGASR
jgi:predicted TIM-barrel fold metal-dependent hydrolase